MAKKLNQDQLWEQFRNSIKDMNANYNGVSLKKANNKKGKDQ